MNKQEGTIANKHKYFKKKMITVNKEKTFIQE
jgi:hypothetical protein